MEAVTFLNNHPAIKVLAGLAERIGGSIVLIET
ncbi:protein of unknown function [Acidithiobacillus ferrivorans]|uniref:Uncharacterized protein n=1 Tax=Acidithiobacillus ferrivorans TaxID=160808 RepID=A0ABY1MPG3_9PROT|nr:protein of unknown function [Acidithiobacillus ferrivorans]